MVLFFSIAFKHHLELVTKSGEGQPEANIFGTEKYRYGYDSP